VVTYQVAQIVYAPENLYSQSFLSSHKFYIFSLPTIRCVTLFFRDYIREKTAESRHNETVGYLTMILGAIFLVGGVLETVVKVENPDWLLFFPYQLTPHPYSLLGLSFSLMGLSLLICGMVLSLKYALERSGYMRELEELRKLEEKTLLEQAQKQTSN